MGRHLVGRGCGGGIPLVGNGRGSTAGGTGCVAAENCQRLMDKDD